VSMIAATDAWDSNPSRTFYFFQFFHKFLGLGFRVRVSVSIFLDNIATLSSRRPPNADCRSARDGVLLIQTILYQNTSILQGRIKCDV